LKFVRWEKIVFGVAIINFATFVMISLWLGGDALNGKVENGHYFLNSHGTYTEVTRSVFEYSKIHATSLFVTHPLALLLGFRAKLRADRNRRISN